MPHEHPAFAAVARPEGPGSGAASVFGKLLIFGGSLAAVAVVIIGVLPFFGPKETAGPDGNILLTVDEAPARFTIYGVNLRTTPDCSVTGPAGEDVALDDAGLEVRNRVSSREYTPHLAFDAAATGEYLVDCLETRIAVGPHVSFSRVLLRAALFFTPPFLLGSALAVFSRRRGIAALMDKALAACQL